jgi:hypothetical protein
MSRLGGPFGPQRPEHASATRGFRVTAEAEALHSDSSRSCGRQSLVLSDVGIGVDPLGRSRACAGDAHRGCGHATVAVRAPVPDHRSESGVALCRCPCHAACPLAGQPPVPLTVWQQWCACAGVGRQRAWEQDRGEPWPAIRQSGETGRRERRARHRARKQAFRAARDAAPGKSREEVRHLYIAELRARGQGVPPGPILDADLDLMTGHPWRGFRSLWHAGPEPLTEARPRYRTSR